MYDTRVIDMHTDFDEGIAEGAKLIKAGDVVAFPTETVYGLGADALRVEAVSAIFAAKGRPFDNPLIVHVSDPDMAMDYAHVTPEAQLLMDAFWPGPLTLVLKKRSKVPYEVTAGLHTVAMRMPDHDVALALIEEVGLPIAAPSANLSGKPSPTTAAHVFQDLNERIPLILDGGPCAVGVESTVLGFDDGGPVILRPGAVTPGMIQEILGTVHLSQSVLTPLLSGETPPSPGMKYKHYAPEASVIIVEGQGAALAEKTIELYDIGKKSGKKCWIFATVQSSAFYGPRDCVIMGDRENPATICRNLFALLRDADKAGVQEIILEALPAQAMGLAYMNRALRAAGFHIVRADDLGG